MSGQPPLQVHGELSPVDVLAFGPHPDDIEIGAGGSLLFWIEQGYRIGLVDLTRGELGTKGDAGTRIAESEAAARQLGARFRINLSLPDGGVRDDDPSREAVVRAIRASRPSLVLSNLEEDLHPDHAAGARLVKSAFFLSRLPRFLPEVKAHSPGCLFFYLIHTQVTPSFLFDITATLDGKLEILEAYDSQFLRPVLPEEYKYAGLSDYMRDIRALNEALGATVGVAAAEAFVSAKPLLLRDMNEWI